VISFSISFSPNFSRFFLYDDFVELIFLTCRTILLFCNFFHFVPYFPVVSVLRRPPTHMTVRVSVNNFASVNKYK